MRFLNVFFLILVAFTFSCTNRPASLDAQQYQKWIASEENGLVNEKEVNHVMLKARYLPADYLAEHCEYGWACTIDAAQGATADVGIVLVRPGMDREHLYVAMTRGRTSNHAYLTPDTNSPGETCDHTHRHRGGHEWGPGDADGHQRPAAGPQQRQVEQREAAAVVASPALDEACVRVLESALATSGAQEAAHTALSNARDIAVTTARRAAQARAAVDAVEHARAEQQAQAPSLEHTATREQLHVLQQQRQGLTADQQQTRCTLHEVREELDNAPRWNRTRKRDLASTLTELQTKEAERPGQLLRFDKDIEKVQQRLLAYDRDLTARRTTRSVAPIPRVTGAPDVLGTLATPTRPNRPGSDWTPGTRPGWRPLRDNGVRGRPTPDPGSRAAGRTSWTDPTWPASSPSPERDGGLSR